MINNLITKIPQPVLEILKALQEAGFEAYIVGGCVRDLLLGREPKDWDITTNALPEQIQKIFPDSFYENTFGTVGIKVEPFSSNRQDHGPSFVPLIGTMANKKDVIEVTTYRTEFNYSDTRRPDKVIFTESLEEDLKRRDFTMNAIALRMNQESRIKNHDKIQKKEKVDLIPNYELQITNYKLTDPFGGVKDIENKVIRAVGDPDERFAEDALRLMRAVRFFAELRTPNTKPDSKNWEIETSTFEALQKNASIIQKVSWERIGDEFSKIILSDSPSEGVDLLQKASLLKYILPEIEEGIGVGQNLHHIYTVYEHNIRALQTCPSKKLEVRLAAFLHDVGKPRAKRGEGYNSTFYNHDHIGARMTEKILTRLRLPQKVIKKATLLVDKHLFYYNVGEVTESSVRRLVRSVGLENMPDLMDVRIADRLGSGTPKAKPYKLRHLEYMIDKVSQDALSVRMLKVNGGDLMQTLDIKPGPVIGAILDVLLAEVIEDQSLNVKEKLLARAQTLSQENVAKLHTMAKGKIEEKRKEEDKEIKKKHWVE